MLKLYGFHVSTYFNMVKLALLEKGFEFEEVRTLPSEQGAQFLSMSPMGKIPCLEAREGFLSETQAIMEFLEEINPEVPLFPYDPFERAKVRELMRVCELYIELPARRFYEGVFFGGTNEPQVIEKVKPQVTKGLAALGRLAKFEPYLAGDSFTYADIVAYYVIGVAAKTMAAVYDWDIMAEVEGLSEWRDMLSSRPIIHSMDKAIAIELESFFNKD